MIKLSKASKMPCRSWSLEALDTCPASKDKHGELVPACRGCYATTGNYRFPNVKAPRVHNKKDWQRDEWVDEMVAALDNDRYFRWFDSGDMYSLALAKKIKQVVTRTPWCRHWIPTRMHKFAKFAKVLAALESLPNVVVRYSSDGIRGEVVPNVYNSSTIVPTIEDGEYLKFTVCMAGTRSGKCGDCRSCWDKQVKVVAYPAHGVKMKAQLKDIIAVA